MQENSFEINAKADLDDALRHYQALRKSEEPENSYLQTSTGLVLDFLNFSSSDVRLEDIATGLSKLCRFNGQCKNFYSVAEHSVLVSRYIEALAEKKGQMPRALISAGLLHDSPEAYLGDMTTPLKRLCPGYKIIEARFDCEIQKAFKLGIGFDHRIVKYCDLRMFFREREVLMPSSVPVEFDEGLDDLLRVRCLPPEEAERAFLERVEELGISLAS